MLICKNFKLAKADVLYFNTILSPIQIFNLRKILVRSAKGINNFKPNLMYD